MMMSQHYAPGFIGGFQPIDAIRTDLNRLFYSDPRTAESLGGNLPIVNYNGQQWVAPQLQQSPWQVGNQWVPPIGSPVVAPFGHPGYAQAYPQYGFPQAFIPVQADPRVVGDPRLLADPRFALDPRLTTDPRFALDPRAAMADPRLTWMASSAHLYSSLSPQVNCAETPDAHLLVVELPGVDVRDISLQVAGNQLILTAFRKPIWNNGTVTVGYYSTEGRFGTLRRVFHLPAGYPASQIQANFVNGQITIVLPKAAAPMGAAAPAANVAINASIPATV